MSTLMLDPATSARLSAQFEAALRRSPARDADLEARRFVAYLCDRLERNNRSLCRSTRLISPVDAYDVARSSRQGESVLLTCLFLLNDLTLRVNRIQLCEYLAATNTQAGRALARRLEARSNLDLRIRAVRFSLDDGSNAQEYPALEAPFAGTGAQQATFKFTDRYPGQMRVGLSIENSTHRAGHFVAAHVRLLARFAENEPWVQTAGDAFGFLERVAGMEGAMLPLRGFDCMELFRGADARNRDPIAVRILARLV
ncbi:MAG: hypothetical protein IT462_16900 [Planctomycetes bacterium]|nr:hypothetical protein [Planctomycetota bacterium]